MKKTFILSNWKSNKTVLQTEEWVRDFVNSSYNLEKNKKIIVCPPFTSLYRLKLLAQENNLNIKLGAGNVSPFDQGAYTGEINAKQIKELADYVIIGHSERRKNFLESDEILERKVDLAKTNSLISIFCVQGKNTVIPKNADIILYEPIDAIGTGIPDDPKNANEVAEFIKNNNSVKVVLYGGSINSENVLSFTSMPYIDGIGVGTASLDASSFLEVINNA
ncbi:MAG: hypothetical protein A3H79_02830 [Candidatus Levybacteria bacterium RIFCSPLOWO2_02_FULL_36_8b]|nr:MAG: hypothetical protein A3H79_02830 [Candidatus Levybacteria bacterium RIFCSPLOWO2_02_FULL_36_8b]